jgi:hypothetical protein
MEEEGMRRKRGISCLLAGGAITSSSLSAIWCATLPRHIAFAWVVVEMVKLWLLMPILVKALVKERRLENRWWR